jgi:hypothetical protein
MNLSRDFPPICVTSFTIIVISVEKIVKFFWQLNGPLHSYTLYDSEKCRSAMSV